METSTDQAKITGEVDTISYHNPDDGWTVIRMRMEPEHRLITLTGHFSSIRVGEFLEAKGCWVEHKRHGKQFKVEQVNFIRPSSTLGILRYLSSGMVKGIGEKTARKIVDHFQEKTFAILDEEPQRLCEVPSIGRKKSASIAKIWSEAKAFRDIEIFLSEHSLSPMLIAKIIRQYRQHTIAVLQKNPYVLATDIRGIGFIKADQIAQRLGIPSDSPQRIQAAVVYLLKHAEEQGHCYLTSQQILGKLGSLLNIDHQVLTNRLVEAIRELNHLGGIVSESVTNGDGTETAAHFHMDLRTAEQSLAEQIKHLLSQPLHVDEERIDRWLQLYSERAQSPLSAAQLAAVKQAASNRVFVLTGGPGVGKTTTANAIIRLLAAMNRDVALCAPTGRAAQRLTEVAGIQAKTVHRLLEFNPQGQGFFRDELNPLTFQAIVIDEASMLDLRLATALFRAIADDAQVILIGDVDQLPSVGAGNVLRDLISSECVPYVKLSEIFRQAAHSQIVQIAHAINQGVLPEFSEDPKSDCRFLDIDSTADIQQEILDWVCDKIPNHSNFDPIRDIQVLTPMNRGDLGTLTLNEVLQKKLNPLDREQRLQKSNNHSFRPGDKVIQNVNNYDLNVFNGDIGLVQYSGVDGDKLIVSFGDRQITYSKEDAYDLRLAYAITIHKSQGSEFPVVLIPISMQHYVMLQRNLVYTALTRARKLAIFVGNRQALQHAIKQQKSLSRQTRLIERIKGL
ncbi:MAG: ATP-dependent RecD-like DNA helicase [Oligoflexus sp.]